MTTCTRRRMERVSMKGRRPSTSSGQPQNCFSAARAMMSGKNNPHIFWTICPLYPIVIGLIVKAWSSGQSNWRVDLCQHEHLCTLTQRVPCMYLRSPTVQLTTLSWKRATSNSCCLSFQPSRLQSLSSATESNVQCADDKVVLLQHFFADDLFCKRSVVQLVNTTSILWPSSEGKCQITIDNN